MKSHLKSIFLCAAFVSQLLLGACASAPNKANDPKAIYTSAALTVAVQLTNMGPQTQAPSETPFPSFTPPPAFTAGLPTTNSGNGSAIATPIPTSSNVADRAQYLSQNPDDDSPMPANTHFTMTWTVKNVGKTTWKTSYMLRFWAGNRLGGPTTVYLPNEVKPDEQVDIKVDMVAPGGTGAVNSAWVLGNDQGANFQPLTLNLKVVPAATATDTEEPTVTEPSCASDPSACTETPTVTATKAP